MQLRIIVITVAGHETELNVSDDDPVEKFQASLERLQGTPVALQVLLVNNKGIDDDEGCSAMVPGHRLRDYDLCADDEVLLVRGLPPRPPVKPPPVNVKLSPKKLGKARAGGKDDKRNMKKMAVLKPMPPLPRCPPPAVNVTRPADVAQQVPTSAAIAKPGSLVVPLLPLQGAAARPEGPAIEPQKAETPTSGSHQLSVNSGFLDASNAKQLQKQGSHASLQLQQQPLHIKPTQQADASLATTSASPSGQALTQIDASRQSTNSSSSVKVPTSVAPKPFAKEPAATVIMAPVAAPKATTAATADEKTGGASVRAASASGLRTHGGNGAVAPNSARAAVAAGGHPMTRLCTAPASLSWSPPATSVAVLPGRIAEAAVAVSPPASARLAGAPHSVVTPGTGAAAVAATPTVATAAPTVAAAAPPAGQRTCSLPPGAATTAARIRRSDLQRVGRLGVGAFGVVTLEMDRRTGKTYALKAVSKGYLVQLHMEYSVLNEKRILKMVDSCFVVRLLATYNGREHVFFLLEAALGGELFTTYERLRLYGSERHARFYMGCVAEALAHLHDRHVVYRDLKPENLLLDARGYCKLTDMGLAKVTQGKTYTLVGTPDYMAPEVILGTGHGKAVDWWMLGVLLFELLAGRAPFEAENTQQVYELVKRGIEAAKFPHECRNLAKELVRRLCRQIPEQRLTTPRLREDMWFRGFDWGALRAMRMTPPYIPHVRSNRDLSNFRVCDGEDPPVTPYQDTGSGWDAGFEDESLGTKTVPAATETPTVATAPPQRMKSEGDRILVYSPRGLAPVVATQSYQPLPRGVAVAPAAPTPVALPGSPSKQARWQAAQAQQTTLACKATGLAQRAVAGHSPPASPVLGGC